MAYSFELRDKALEELTDAVVWYEEQQEGLGKSLRLTVQNKLKKICNNPFHYKVSHKIYREALTDKFPFLIIYILDEKIKLITVIAIFHTSRSPKKKFRKR